MSVKPKYSFIIPVYQTGKYLPKCINSIIEQSFDDFELILIDDGSNDGSEKVCDDYSQKDNRIVTIHKKNEGQGIARNLGVANAKGKYIIFLDSDDYWLSNDALKKIDHIMSDNDVVFFDLKFYYDKLYKSLNITTNLKKQYENGRDFLVDVLNRNHSFPWYPVLYAFKKDLWVNNSIAFQPHTYYEDQGTIYKIPLFAKKIAVLKEDIYAYRQTRKNSTTKNISSKLLEDHINICNDSISYIQHLDIDDILSRLLLNNVACGYIDIMNHMYGLQKNDYKSIKNIMLKNISMLDYLKYGKHKYMAKFVKVFGFDFSTFIFGIIHRIK